MSEQSKEKLPKRIKAHVIGDRALNVFKVKANPEWACEDKRIDYGYDLNIHVAKDEKVREHFFIQLKGHESPNYIEDKKFISEQLEVSTINFLQIQAIPAMICVCHVDLKQEKEEPIFYIWLEDAIKEIEKVNKNWRSQEYVNIRISTNNIFNKEVQEQIFAVVTEHYRALKTSKIVVDVLGPAIGIEKEKIGKLTTEETLYAIAPHLEKAGLIDETTDGMEALTPHDQEILRKVKEISVLLNNYSHEAAKQILDEIALQIDSTHDSIKARFYNNYGVLHMHLGDGPSAFEYYQKAVNLKPSDTKYLINCLYAEYELFIKHDKSEPDKERSWAESLDHVIKENKDIHSAIRLKTFWIGKKQGCESAFRFIKSTETWSKEPIDSRICIAEIFKNENKYEDAISILREVEKGTEPPNFKFWSLYGYLLFSQALGIFSKEKESYITGLGSTKIKFALLKEAEQKYKKAYDILLKKGFPIFIEDIAVNYTTVLYYLNKHEEALHVCKTVLARYPDSKGILGQIALSYSNLGKPEEAIPFARKEFEVNKNTTTLKNYCLCLMEAEEYVGLKDVLDEYINNDIIEQEKGLFYGLYAISCNEIGLPKKADEYLQAMKKDDSMLENAIIAESVICHKNGGKRNEVLEIYKKGLSKNPKSILLHTNYANNLKPTDKSEANEIISSYIIINRVRELYPDEYIAYGWAYLTLNKPEEAVPILKIAHDNYPDNTKIQYMLADAFVSSGDEESAYTVLVKYLEKSTSDYHIIRNMATLAFDTGRLDESIKFFQKALSKTTDPKIRGEIHCHLFELKRRRGDQQKEILRHVHEFGQTIKDDIDKEARYLSMFMTATFNYTENDNEGDEWFSVARKRLDNFNKGKYKSPYFKSFSFDSNIPEEKKGMDILSTMMAEMLPHIMKSGQLSIAMRSNAYPLTIKSRFLNRGSSVFGFWSNCMQSKEKEFAINIFINNDLTKEDQIAKTAKYICIDISALLTLAEFNLLEVLDEFEIIYLARGTKALVDAEFFGLTTPHDLAKKIENWRLAKRDKIRIKNYMAADKEILSSLFCKFSQRVYSQWFSWFLIKLQSSQV
ncbi:MAG: DUF4365 domain-containing protein [Nitrospirota bacterium]